MSATAQLELLHTDPDTTLDNWILTQLEDEFPCEMHDENSTAPCRKPVAWLQVFKCCGRSFRASDHCKTVTDEYIRSMEPRSKWLACSGCHFRVKTAAELVEWIPVGAPS